MMSPLAKGKISAAYNNFSKIILRIKHECLCFLGLFSKAIAQSGTNLAAWSQPAHKGVAKDRATKLAESFKCYEPNSWPKTLDCLRNVSAENITAAFYDFFVIYFLKRNASLE